MKNFEKEILPELFKNNSITDISFNGKDIYIQDNKIGRYKLKDEVNINDVENYIKQMTYQNNEQFNDETPILDTEYPNLRINAIHKSLAPYGMTVSLRSSKANLQIKDYDKDIAPKELFSLLKTFIESNLNIIISGKTGSGKTELQKYLTGFINKNNKIVLIEDTLDTHLKNIYPDKDILSWKTNTKLEKEINFDHLIKAGLRNNPDWIIISETRGSEAYSMLKSSLSGHNIITTIHSNGAKNNVDRLIHMCKEGYNLDEKLLGSIISEVFDIGIHLDYTIDEKGVKRYIAEVVEYLSYSDIGINCNTIFKRENKIKKVNNNYLYEPNYHFGKISLNLFNKLASSKTINNDIEIFLKEEYFEKD